MTDCVGQQFGNYRLTGLLGEGGFAEVYLGQHVRLELQAAIKVLHTHLSGKAVEQFYQEAQTLATLVHPTIVRVFDYDVQEGVPFLVMDYAPGGSLRRRYPKGSVVPLAQILSSVQQVAAALQYAHDHKVIHRDVKPENMLLGRHQQVLLSDFGLAALVHSTASEVAQGTVGTIAYMAPEQIEGHPRAASDQYSLAIVVYEWLCGARPFQGSMSEVLVQHLSLPPPPLRERVPTVPVEVEQVVLKALAKDPKQRFARVQDFALALHVASTAAASAGSTQLMLASEYVAPARQTTTHNLPVHLTSLIGREHERAAACTLLRRPDSRLLTFTGTGGVGKTRLALQVATDLLNDFPDGVSFVPLAPLSDPNLVMPTLAQALEVKEAGAQSLLDLLKAFLRDKHLLLVLDNFEQVIEAAVQVAELLAACPRLKIIVTSRVVLHVQAEREFPVPPLSLPDLKRLPDLATLSQYEAVALFIERAQAVKADFAVTNANAPAVASICSRLDGLPLAIELAAARTKFFAPQALLARLEQGLALLTGGARDLPARQQTLRGAIAWSYDLLSSEEQRLFRRMAVFVDGWTIEAAEVVCRAAGGLEADVLDGLFSLVDKSLLRQEESTEGEPRFWMLQLLREFGLEALASTGESELTRQAHAEYYLGMAEEAEPRLKGPGQTPWFARLEQEHENLRAGLTFLLERAREEGVVQAERALRFFAALEHYWLIRGYLSEGQHFLEAALGLFHAAERTVARARALAAAAELTLMLDDYAGACTLAEESAALARELGQKACLAYALSQLAWARDQQGDATTGQLLIEESIALAREAEDAWLLASLLFELGRLLILQNKLAAARAQFEQCVSLFRELADKRALSKSLDWLAYSVLSEGDVGQAQALWQESLTLAREVGDQVRIQTVLRQLGYTAIVQGNWEQAENLLKEGLALAREIGLKRGVATALNYSAQLAQRRGDLAQAADLSEESLVLSREMGHMWDILEHLLILGEIRRDQGNLAQARALFEEGLSLAQQAGDEPFIRLHLVGLASLAVAKHQSQQAARLFGAAEGLFDVRKELDSDPYRRTVYERDVANVRAQLSEGAFASAWAQGRTMPLEQIIAEVLRMEGEAGTP